MLGESAPYSTYGIIMPLVSHDLYLSCVSQSGMNQETTVFSKQPIDSLGTAEQFDDSLPKVLSVLCLTACDLPSEVGLPCTTLCCMGLLESLVAFA